MDDLIPTTLFPDHNIEILPPERHACPIEQTSSCLCCGRRATIDEDCCGICEECLSA
jgi:hypothetical protein